MFEGGGDRAAGRNVLMTALEGSRASQYWHCRLTFQLAALHTSVQDYNSAHAVLQSGADYAFMNQAYYARSLFVLSKTMLFLSEKRFQVSPYAWECSIIAVTPGSKPATAADLARN